MSSELINKTKTLFFLGFFYACGSRTVFGKVRVVRECGYIKSDYDDKGCIKRSGTFEVQNFFCSCTGDLCNAAPSVHQSTIFIVVALIIGLIATFKRK